MAAGLGKGAGVGRGEALGWRAARPRALSPQLLSSVPLRRQSGPPVPHRMVYKSVLQSVRALGAYTGAPADALGAAECRRCPLCGFAHLGSEGCWLRA